MKFGKTLLTLLAPLIIGIGCGERKENPKPEPTLISGEVKGENFNCPPLGRDSYNFTLSTKYGLKEFEYKGGEARKFDASIDPKDSLTVKIADYDEPTEGHFYISWRDIIEINGDTLNPIH